MRLLFYISCLMICGKSFSQSCTINISSNQVLINDEFITFNSFDQFQKTLGTIDSINYRKTFLNEQIRLTDVFTLSHKPTNEYGIEISFEKNVQKDSLLKPVYLPLNYFTGQVILDGIAVTDSSTPEQFKKLKGWKFVRRGKSEVHSSYLLYNKSLEMILEFKNGLLKSLLLVPAKGYYKFKRG